MFVLNDPSKHPFKYDYHVGGFPLGPGLRLPSRFQLPELGLPRFISKDGTLAGTGATSDFDGGGKIFRFTEKELEPSDFVGLTLSLDFSGGVLVAGGITSYLAGLHQLMVTAWLFNPGLFANALFRSAKALVVMVGVSEGLVDGINATPMMGSISQQGPYIE